MVKYIVYKNDKILIDNVSYNQAFGLLDSAQRILLSNGMKSKWSSDHSTTFLEISNGNVYKVEEMPNVR